MSTIFALMALGMVACGPEKDDTGENPEADADTDADSDTDGDTDLDSGCADDSPVPEEWPEIINGADVHFGWGERISALGDVDGDGHDDIGLEGALVLRGPFCPDESYEDQVAAVLDDGAAHGWQNLDGAGDVDGDGLADILVGDIFLDDFAGEVFLALSPVEGEVFLPHVAVANIVGETEDGYFGGAVEGVGDVDGDGVPDLLVGAEYEDDDGGLRNGAAWLFPGTTRGYHAASEVGVAIRGSEEYPTVGYTLAALGDTDGDGLADFLVGTHDGPLHDSVALFRGPVATDMAFVDADALFLAHPDDEYGGCFGSRISSAGDQDGDGLPEIAIGAPCLTLSVEEEGAVYLFGGSTSGVFDRSQARSTLAGEAEGDEAGTGVDLAGDVNGDGQADLVVGAAGFGSETSSGSVGAIYLVLGPIAEGSQSLASADVRVAGTYDESHHDLGYDALGAGDTNGDGLDDILVVGWMEAGSSFLHSHLLLGRE